MFILSKRPNSLQALHALTRKGFVILHSLNLNLEKLRQKPGHDGAKAHRGRSWGWHTISICLLTQPTRMAGMWLNPPISRWCFTPRQLAVTARLSEAWKQRLRQLWDGGSLVPSPGSSPWLYRNCSAFKKSQSALSHCRASNTVCIIQKEKTGNYIAFGFSMLSEPRAGNKIIKELEFFDIYLLWPWDQQHTTVKRRLLPTARVICSELKIDAEELDMSND